MADWMKNLLSVQGTADSEPESNMHEWAEFNLPARDDLKVLFNLCEDENTGRLRAIA